MLPPLSHGHVGTSVSNQQGARNAASLNCFLTQICVAIIEPLWSRYLVLPNHICQNIVFLV